jgi:ABC-2 type transport system permease protein
MKITMILQFLSNFILIIFIPLTLALLLLIRGVWTIYKREVKAYFYSSIAYVFLALIVLIPNVFFFYFNGGIFKEGMATMRSYFAMLPFMYVFFIPGLTMGVWSKEKNTGTIELIFTLPVSQIEITIGKFLASFTLVCISLYSTLLIPVMTHFMMGSFDWGQISTQYFGALLMSICYIAITFFMSSLTKELINSFLLSVAVLLFLALIGYIAMTVNFPQDLSWMKIVFQKISLLTHFKNFSVGVMDSRDFFYYLGLASIFFYFNLHSLQSRKWS